MLRLIVGKLTGDTVRYLRERVLDPRSATDIAPMGILPGELHSREPWYYNPALGRSLRSTSPGMEYLPTPYTSWGDVVSETSFVVSAEALVRYMRRFHLFNQERPLMVGRGGRWSPPEIGRWTKVGSWDGTFAIAIQQIDRELSIAALFNRRGAGDDLFGAVLEGVADQLPESVWPRPRRKRYRPRRRP